jgi:hypothetical protein
MSYDEPDQRYEECLTDADFEWIRYLVDDLFRHHTPPLTDVDVVGLAFEERRVFFQRRFLPRNKPLRQENVDRFYTPAFMAVYKACPGAVEAAALIPTETADLELASPWIMDGLASWLWDTLQPALDRTRETRTSELRWDDRDECLARFHRAIWSQSTAKKETLLLALEGAARESKGEELDKREKGSDYLAGIHEFTCSNPDDAFRVFFVDGEGCTVPGRYQVRDRLGRPKRSATWEATVTYSEDTLDAIAAAGAARAIRDAQGISETVREVAAGRLKDCKARSRRLVLLHMEELLSGRLSCERLAHRESMAPSTMRRAYALESEAVLGDPRVRALA